MPQAAAVDDALRLLDARVIAVIEAEFQFEARVAFFRFDDLLDILERAPRRLLREHMLPGVQRAHDGGGRDVVRGRHHDRVHVRMDHVREVRAARYVRVSGRQTGIRVGPMGDRGLRMVLKLAVPDTAHFSQADQADLERSVQYTSLRHCPLLVGIPNGTNSGRAASRCRTARCA